VVLDTSSKVMRDAVDVFGYYSWGSNDSAIKDRHLNDTFVPGALAGEFVSTDARTFQEPPAAWRTNALPFRGSHQSLIGDLIRDGITGVAGHVAEPFLNATIRPDLLFPAYLTGANLAEAFYTAMPFLSWQTVVVGDPLCAPFRSRGVDTADLDAGLDPVTELPTFLAQRRIAALTAAGAKREAAQAIAKAEVHEWRGDTDGAISSLQDAVTIQPTLAAAQRDLATLQETQGNWDSAIASYQQVIAYNPHDAVALNNLAYMLAVSKGDPSAALPFAKRAYAAPNAPPEAGDTLAWTEHLLGNDAEAVPLIVTAAKRLPQSFDVHFHAAAILSATGNLAAARTELDLATRLAPQNATQPAVVQLANVLSGTSK
jgi:Flp pilus assembly protein TadD